MKFIKFDWKMWFFACGMAAVMIVIIDLFMKITKLGQSLIEVFIYLFFFNIFNSSLRWLHSRIGKIRYYFVINGIAFVLLWIQRIVIDIVRNDAIHWIRNLIVAVFAIGIAAVGLAIFELIWYFRNKNMNRKLKEYQDKNKDKD